MILSALLTVMSGFAVKLEAQSGSSNAGGEGSSQFTALSTAPEANLFSGSMSMSVPIQIPPGRKSATPQLALSYSSGAGSNPFGYGWDLPLGSIERSTKYGRPRCLGYQTGDNHTRDFVLMLSGGSMELVYNGPAHPNTQDIHRYLSKVDEAYVEAIADVPNNTWTVHDRAGMIYRFGDVSSARGFNRLDTFIDEDFDLIPPDCEFTSIWALTQIADPHGNTVDISYFKDQNTLYPDEIYYGANPSAGLNEHPFKVKFLRALRSYPIERSHRGVVERMEQLIERIEVYYRPQRGAAYEIIRAYDLSHEDALEYGRSLLVQIDDDPTIAGDLLPSQTFSYASAPFGHQSAINYLSPAGNYLGQQNTRYSPDTLRSMLDMNGDGRVDIVSVDTGNAARWLVHLGHSNGNGGFESSVDWSLPPDLPRSHRRAWSGIAFSCWTDGGNGCFEDDEGDVPFATHTWFQTLDITGDGIPDFVDARTTPWRIFPGYCNSTMDCGFGAAQDWAAPAPYVQREFKSGADWWTERWLMDVSGDGLPDYIVGNGHFPTTDVYLNTGQGFELAIDASIAGGTITEGSAGLNRVRRTFFDFNGDGLPDHLERGAGNLIDLRLNTGRGLGNVISLAVSNGDNYVRAGNSSGTFADFLDVNGDGLPDRVWEDGTGWQVQLNHAGTGLSTAASAWPGAPSVLRRQSSDGSHNIYTKVDVFDFNGDGFLDHVDATNHTWAVRLGGPQQAPHVKPLLLVKSENGIGGFTEIDYAPSSEFGHTNADANPDHDLPFNSWVVREIRRGDGISSDIVQSFHYEGGLFDAVAREFRGFRQVTQTDSDGNQRVLTYGQGDFDRGKLLLDEQYVGSQLLSRDTYIWQEQQPVSFVGRTQVFLAERKSEEFSLTGDSSLDRCVLNRNQPPDEWGRVSHSCSLPCAGAPSTLDSCADPVIAQVDTITLWGDPLPNSSVRERPLQTTTSYIEASGNTKFLAQKSFYYDGFGTTSVTGLPHDAPLGQVEKGDLKRVLTAGGGVLFNQYDAFGNITEVTDPLGHVSLSIYDADLFSLYPVKEQAPSVNGVVHEVERETDLRFAKVTRSIGKNGEEHLARYDGLGRSICEAGPGEDLSGCGGSGAFNHRVEHSFHWGDPDANDFESKLSFVEQRIREPNAPQSYLVNRQYFDGLQRARFSTLQRVIGSGPDLSEVVSGQVDYDVGNRVAAQYVPYVLGGQIVQQPNVAAIHYDYHLNGGAHIDPQGRAHRITLPDAKETLSYYEALRTRVVRAQSTALEGETRSIEDDFGRVLRKEHYAGEGGTLLSHVDFTYDGMGRVLTETTSGDTATTLRHTYDFLGREIVLQDPDSGFWISGYDLNGRLIYRDDPEPGQHVQWLYDALGRVTHVCTFSVDTFVNLNNDCGSGEAAAHFTYDDTIAAGFAIGRLSRVEDQTGFENFVYDERGRVTEQTREILGIEATSRFHYDEVDRLVRTIYPDGQHVPHNYNAAGQLSSTGAHITAIEYDLLGRVKKIAHNNGVEDLRSYYSASAENARLKTIQSLKDGEAHLDLSYEYNSLGKIERIDDHRDSEIQGVQALSNAAVYEYDTLGRLRDVDWLPGVAGADEHDDAFEYSAIGNITHKDGNAFVYSPMYPHQVISFAGKDLEYDANGRRISKGSGSEAQNYHYDAFDRLTRIDFVNGQSVDYRYDYNGQRVAKRVNAGPWKRYFGALVESEIDAEGQGWYIKHFFAGDTRVATLRTPSEFLVETNALAPTPLQIPAWFWALFAGVTLVLLFNPGRGETQLGISIGPARAMGSSFLVLLISSPMLLGLSGCVPVVGELRHYHVDHLGSTQALSDHTGALVQQMRYAAYGEVRGRFDSVGSLISEIDAVRHEFTGYASEMESGLQYAGARYYDPELAQFISHDPEQQYASPYAYGPGDPINGTDPNGAVFVEIVVAALIAGAIAAAVNFTLAFVQTGNVKVALRSAAQGFAAAFLTSLIPPLANVGVGAVLGGSAGNVAELSTRIMLTGYGSYSVVESAREGDWLGALSGAMGAVIAARGIAKGFEGLSTSKSVSGDFGEGSIDASKLFADNSSKSLSDGPNLAQKALIDQLQPIEHAPITSAKGASFFGNIIEWTGDALQKIGLPGAARSLQAFGKATGVVGTVSEAAVNIHEGRYNDLLGTLATAAFPPAAAIDAGITVAPSVLRGVNSVFEAGVNRLAPYVPTTKQVIQHFENMKYVH